VKLRDAVAPVVSLKVTVQVTVPDQVGLVSTTLGRKVIDTSEWTVTLLFQSLVPLSQITLPLAAPLQVNVTRLTLLKLMPLAESVASWGALLAVIVEGVRLVKLRAVVSGGSYVTVTDFWLPGLPEVSIALA